jgi:Protein of unknown function (DUF3040)
MSTRDDANLTDRERAAFAGLEAAAAVADPGLAGRLQRSSRLRSIIYRVRRRCRGWAVPLVLAGLALMVLSLSTTSVLGVAGALLVAGGLHSLARAVHQRWGQPDRPG